MVGLLARYVFFKEKFEEIETGLNNIQKWQDDYRAKNPNATEAEVDAAFDASMGNLNVWQEKYKQEHPNATKEEMDQAFSDQFKQ